VGNTFRCPACGVVSIEHSWNAATIARYDEDVVFIHEKDDESASFVCPNCSRESEGSEISRGESIIPPSLPSLTVKFRRLSPAARIPTYGTAGAAAFDLYAAADVIVAPGETVKVPLGFAVEIPEGHAMFIVPRSGISEKTPLRVANSPGVVDADYRGEVAVLIENSAPESEFDDAYPWKIDGWVDSAYEGDGCAYYTYNIYAGDRIAQAYILPVPRVTFTETDEDLTETERGDSCFGSTGIA